MAILSAVNPTLADVAKRLDPQGNVDTVVEILNLTNDILDDATFIEGNLPTGHRTTVRTGIPAPTWRKLYGGVQPTKSTTVQVTDNTGMMENYAEVDKALVDLNGNTPAFRMSEELAIIEGFNQEFATTLLYGNEGTNPATFTGLAPRYNSLSAASGDNIISGGGSSNLTSIWLVCWGPQTIHCIYPKGSKAGLQINDKGQVTIENADGAGGRMEAYRTHYRWDVGLSVRDWRYAVRIANIDVNALTKNASAGADLIDLLAQACERLPAAAMGRPVFYANRTIRSFLRRQIANKVAASTLTMETVGGKKVAAFDGMPFKRVDKILNTESQVS